MSMSCLDLLGKLSEKRVKFIELLENICSKLLGNDIDGLRTLREDLRRLLSLAESKVRIDIINFEILKLVSKWINKVGLEYVTEGSLDILISPFEKFQLLTFLNPSSPEMFQKLVEIMTKILNEGSTRLSARERCFFQMMIQYRMFLFYHHKSFEKVKLSLVHLRTSYKHGAKLFSLYGVDVVELPLGSGDQIMRIVSSIPHIQLFNMMRVFLHSFNYLHGPYGLFPASTEHMSELKMNIVSFLCEICSLCSRVGYPSQKDMFLYFLPDFMASQSEMELSSGNFDSSRKLILEAIKIVSASGDDERMYSFRIQLLRQQIDRGEEIEKILESLKEIERRVDMLSPHQLMAFRGCRIVCYQKYLQILSEKGHSEMFHRIRAKLLRELDTNVKECMRMFGEDHHVTVKTMLHRTGVQADESLNTKIRRSSVLMECTEREREEIENKMKMGQNEVKRGKRLKKRTRKERVEKKCDNCGKGGPSLKKCGGCKRVSYCNLKCQKNDWKLHKKNCMKKSI